MDTVLELNSVCFKSDMQEFTVSNVMFPQIRNSGRGIFFSTSHLVTFSLDWTQQKTKTLNYIFKSKSGHFVGQTYLAM